MKTISLLIVILQLINLIQSLPHHTDFQDRVYPAPLPREYVESFRKFSMKNALSPSFNIDQNDLKNDRAIQSSPLSLGSLFALVNEKVFKIETRDLSQALELENDKISKVYSSVVNTMSQDVDIVLSNGIFTRNENFETTPGLSDLHSFVQTIKLAENDKAVEAINNYVANHTENLIVDQFLPSDSPFYKSTTSVVVNTAYIKKTFKAPLIPIGKKEFRVCQNKTEFVDTLEMTSENMSVYRGEHFSAVMFKLGANKKKSVVLVKPVESLSQFMKNDVKDIFGVDFLQKFEIQSQKIRVQVPVLNFTLARTFSSEYEALQKIPSFTSAICDSATDKENLLQKIVQISSVRLTSTALQLAVAMGVSVDNVKEYRTEFGAGDVNATSESDPLAGGKLKIKENVAADAVSEPEPEPEVAPVARAILSQEEQPEKYVPVHIQKVQPLMPRFSDTTLTAKVKGQVDDLIFDSPFFIYLQDEELGPFEFLAVRSPVVFADNVAQSEDFSDYQKLSRFVCLAPPPPCLPKHKDIVN